MLKFKGYFDLMEAVHIIICIFAISFGFSIAFAHFSALIDYPLEFLVFFFISFVTVGSGFVLHEMGHKLVALHYGAPARFVMWFQGIALMLITSFFGFLFAAPGAVYIYSQRITPKQNAIISVVGPLVNVVIALFFLFLSSLYPTKIYLSFINALIQNPGFGISGGYIEVWRFGAAMNLILGMFNMIPAFPLDGSKVFSWNKIAWFVATAILLILSATIVGFSSVVGWAIMMVLALVFSKLAFGSVK